MDVLYKHSVFFKLCGVFLKLRYLSESNSNPTLQAPFWNEVSSLFWNILGEGLKKMQPPFPLKLALDAFLEKSSISFIVSPLCLDFLVHWWLQASIGICLWRQSFI